ncbi:MULTISPECIES: MaoC family dehydratase [unclassified Arthrobacter]|uniref:MaoC family dehydratase n=1 Tax=unclassified Arthrobacter TaxID=235627 RepID=UPI002DFD7CC0|nr:MULTISPECIES: MaoC family dehydratase [unclassified Arthrobacter]MEC5193277.1 acyl dehydratase [Arthrobacter sp. MP_M4]MEC5204750.1 acyl dehydratase [Arthrobacter sp. MP_M7]
MRLFENAAELASMTGKELGVSGWHTLDQTQIQSFADATLDQQWIHTDPGRAAAGPYGATVAHGYLSLSMLPYLAGQVYRVQRAAMIINYGLNKVRFPAPARVNSRIRDRLALASVTDTAKGLQLQFHHVIELEGSEKPACIAETVSLLRS